MVKLITYVLLLILLILLIISIVYFLKPRGETLQKGIINHTIFQDSKGEIWNKICIDGESYLESSRYNGHTFQYLTIPDPNPKYSVCGQ